MPYPERAEQSRTIPVTSSEKSVPTMSATTFMGGPRKPEISDRQSSIVFCDNIVMSRRPKSFSREVGSGDPLAPGALNFQPAPPHGRAGPAQNVVTLYFLACRFFKVVASPFVNLSANFAFFAIRFFNRVVSLFVMPQPARMPGDTPIAEAAQRE